MTKSCLPKTLKSFAGAGTSNPAWCACRVPADPLAGNSSDVRQSVADPESWCVLDAAYLAHHVNCITCQAAAGRGANYALRCGVGTSLWRDYESTTMRPTGIRQRGVASRP
jgi:hypothetical protein